jgi:hypothetical protein
LHTICIQAPFISKFLKLRCSHINKYKFSNA